jgi:hypothetical protein
MAAEEILASGDHQRERIAGRADLLWKLTTSCESDVAKFLLISTAGGAVATLSFMGTAPELRGMIGPRVALCAFLAGIVACGTMLAARALNASSAYVRFLSDAEEFRKSAISWNELAKRSSPTHGQILLGTLASITFICLAVGVIAGAWTVWTRS